MRTQIGAMTTEEQNALAQCRSIFTTLFSRFEKAGLAPALIVTTLHESGVDARSSRSAKHGHYFVIASPLPPARALTDRAPFLFSPLPGG